MPDGYVGTVRVDYAVPGAPPLEVIDGLPRVEIDDTGIARTSSPDPGGLSRQAYRYRTPAGLASLPDWPRAASQRRIWRQRHGEDRSAAAGRRAWVEFFVGTEAQARQHEGAAPGRITGAAEVAPDAVARPPRPD